jgi:hypothetical protein
MGFNPFARHVGKPEPIQAQPDAESTGEQPTDSTPATEPEPPKAPEDQVIVTATVAATVAATSAPNSPTVRAANPFSHHAVGPKVRPKAERTRKPPAQALLDWTQRWDKPTIRLRDIQVFGPLHMRKREAAIKQADVLVKYNWLIPVKPSTGRRDSVEWKIVRVPIIQPTVAALSPTVAATVAASPATVAM